MLSIETAEILLLNKIAIIFKHVGYAKQIKKGYTSNSDVPYRYTSIELQNGRLVDIDPYFSGDDMRRECMARRQLDVLEQYLYKEQYDLFIHSAQKVKEPKEEINYHEFRTLQIKYCLDLLEINE